MNNPDIYQFKIGPLDNFLYLLGDPETKEMAVVDPAWDAPFLSDKANELGYTITKIFLTHGHPDHVNGLDEMLDRHDVPVYMSDQEANYYRPRVRQMVFIKDGEIIQLGKLTFETTVTPGHTPGCQVFHCGKHLIVGDLLFVAGCGRVDLPGGNARAMYHSLHHILKKFPDETIIYPGHDYGATPTDTLGHQRKTNPYLVTTDENEFLSERL